MSVTKTSLLNIVNYILVRANENVATTVVGQTEGIIFDILNIIEKKLGFIYQLGQFDFLQKDFYSDGTYSLNLGGGRYLTLPEEINENTINTISLLYDRFVLYGDTNGCLSQLKLTGFDVSNMDLTTVSKKNRLYWDITKSVGNYTIDIYKTNGTPKTNLVAQSAVFTTGSQTINLIEANSSGISGSVYIGSLPGSSDNDVANIINIPWDTTEAAPLTFKPYNVFMKDHPYQIAGVTGSYPTHWSINRRRILLNPAPFGSDLLSLHINAVENQALLVRSNSTTTLIPANFENVLIAGACYDYLKLKPGFENAAKEEQTEYNLALKVFADQYNLKEELYAKRLR